MSINGDQLGECASAKNIVITGIIGIHILSQVIVQDDRTVKINYQNNNNYHYYNNNHSKQCQLGFINPLGLLIL